MIGQYRVHCVRKEDGGKHRASCLEPLPRRPESELLVRDPKTELPRTKPKPVWEKPFPERAGSLFPDSPNQARHHGRVHASHYPGLADVGWCRAQRGKESGEQRRERVGCQPVAVPGQIHDGSFRLVVRGEFSQVDLQRVVVDPAHLGRESDSVGYRESETWCASMSEAVRRWTGSQ